VRRAKFPGTPCNQLHRHTNTARSEACPDASIQDYAEVSAAGKHPHSSFVTRPWQAQQAVLLLLVGLSTLSIVLRVFDQAKIVGDITGLVLRAASLFSAGVSHLSPAHTKKLALSHSRFTSF
jgi:hypothetical protein